MTTVHCSGLSGDGTAAGHGIARSLRAAFTDLRIVGVGDVRDTALHDAVFDDVRPAPAGGDARAVAELLGEGDLWIPGTEREARLLADGGCDGILSPSRPAIARLDDAAARLALLSIPAISAQADDWQLNAFGRAHGWRLSLVGPFDGATRIDGWRALERARVHAGAAWEEPRLYLQAQVDGAAESVVFAAHRGTLLGARLMRRAIAGDTAWGARTGALADALPAVAGALAAELEQTGWTGGGEIEIVRSVDGAAWLKAWRPRFPAWVHGATLAGANLPAALVGAAAGIRPARAVARSQEFVRVVVELPARLALPEPIAASRGVVRAGGYLSSMPDPERAGERAPRSAPTAPSGPLAALLAGLPRATATPHAHRIDPGARWSEIAARCAAAARGRALRIAYSMKTDPDVPLLRAARAHGFLAEAISAAEWRRALDAGFAGGEVILNGPGKRWPASVDAVETFAAFADSLEDMTSLAASLRSGRLRARYLGPRVRPPSMASRFGIDLGDFDAFRGLVAALRDLPAEQALGVHFHWASSEAGHDTWFEVVEATLSWSRSLQELTGRPVRCLDVGGGWSPDDFDTVFVPRLAALVARCHAELDGLELVVLEPGRALVQPLSVVEASVLERRERSGVRELVVDASLAEVPRAPVFPHRILSRSGGGQRLWGRGPDRIVGRLCMEDDVLRAGIAVPDDVDAGSRLLIADAGGYDRSMAYAFGSG